MGVGKEEVCAHSFSETGGTAYVLPWNSGNKVEMLCCVFSVQVWHGKPGQAGLSFRVWTLLVGFGISGLSLVIWYSALR